MKRKLSWRIVLISNIFTALLIFFGTILLKQKEVRRRDDLIMTVLVGDVASLKHIANGRVEDARRLIFRNIELVSSARKEFTPFGYYGWDDLDTYLRREGMLK